MSAGAESIQIATLVVTAGAVMFAVAASVWAMRVTTGARAAQAIWKRRVTDLEDKLTRADSTFGAYPGLVLVWDTPPDLAGGAVEDWAKPRIFGSPSALASLLKFAEAADGPDPGSLLLEGVADYEARAADGEETTLRRRFAQLVTEGKPLSLTILGPEGRFLEADGRAAGLQIALFLSDATIRGMEISGARGRVEESRRTVEADPAAFLDTLERAPFPAWRMNASGRLEWANAAYAAAVDAKDAADAVARQIALDPGLKGQAGEAVKAGEAVAKTRPVVIAGKRRALDLVTFPVSGGAAGFALDVTEAEESKAALKRFRRAHDDTLNHMAEAVAVFDRGQRLVFHNTAFEHLYSLDPSWLNDRPSHGELLDRLREKRLLPEQADYAAWKKGELNRYDAAPGEESPDELWPLPDGRTLRVARQRHPLGGLMLIFEDKTDELALRARYNTLINVQRATLDKLHEAVAVFGSDGRLRLHNTAFEGLWKLSSTDLEGQPAFESIVKRCESLHPDAEAWAEMKARVTDPSPQARKHVTGEWVRSDDKVLTYLSRPLPDGATLIAWDDVTDSRRIEEALRDRAEALEASDRIKSEFVEHVSYQLRTPLTTISGYTDMIMQGFAGELSERQQGPMTAIKEASEELAKLIDNVLDVAAIDAGQLELELGDADLGAIAEESAAFFAAKAEHAGVRISLDDRTGEASLIRADARRLKQVVLNLLSNAIRHTPKGGTVTIALEHRDGSATIAVKDEGEGIDPERLARVFERFERGVRGGAGLGLALVKEIVELHGGWVDLESEPERGTTVVVHLPEEAAEAHAAPELDLKGRLKGEAKAV
ncbi:MULTISPECIES: sensor histidine kinase [Hyphobacterium]|uniref:histidine kinase n=1 Tax=Hyphobacterium vulgare TaxID=1736751 RepID=A0ABV6ZXR6_9PROT